MENNVILSSLAMDVKRVAIGLNRKSYHMADRFLQEAMKRKKEVQKRDVPPYMQKILGKLDHLMDRGRDHGAEDALMYSTLLQNYITYRYYVKLEK